MVLSLLIGGMEWRAGDQVLTLEREFPNNLYLPALLAKHGVELVQCKWPHFWDAIGPVSCCTPFLYSLHTSFLKCFEIVVCFWNALKHGNICNKSLKWCITLFLLHNVSDLLLYLFPTHRQQLW